MASPRPAATPVAPAQPLTPPAEQSSSSNAVPIPANPPNPTPNTPITNPPQVPGTSLQDNGKTRRPRDARLIHMLLSASGVSAYQERVPLQLLDFAYRYTSSVLQDAVYLATEGYAGELPKGEGGKSQQASQELSTVSLQALRMSIASRLHYQFQPGLPKEFLMDVAAERNRMMLPGLSRGGADSGMSNVANTGIVMGGICLPPERFCQTGVNWGLKDEWESEGEEEMEIDAAGQQEDAVNAATDGEEEGGAEDDDADGKMEDIFGEDAMDEDGDEDKPMTGV